MKYNLHSKALFFILMLLSFNVCGQGNTFFSDESDNHASISAIGIATTNNEVPFWLRTNQNGSIPLDGISGAIIGAFYHDYKQNEETDKWYENKWDWGVGFQGRINMGNAFRGQLIEGYAKVKYSIFQAKLGRSKDLMGLVDTTLSSGAFATSGNALGIPKFELSIPDYWAIPGTKELISIKGTFSVGYAGEAILRFPYDSVGPKTTIYYHQKSLYGRIGKPDWKIKLYGGFNHQVFWGGERKFYGAGFKPNDLGAFWYVLTGKAYVNNGIIGSKVGNHIGSIDQAITFDFKSVLLSTYHQFFYDVGGLYHLSNLRDGLWGISFSNKSKTTRNIAWNKFVFEFLYSKSQGGELRANPTPSGDEDYYNNDAHYTGWTYNHQNIGNNFFTNKDYMRKDLPSYKNEFIGNSRVMLLHAGAEWLLNQWSITNKFSFSRNYGTYATSPIGNTTGQFRNVQPPPYFSVVDQFSGYVEASRPLKNNFSIGFAIAGDYGDLLYNSFGGFIKVTKTW